MPDQATEVYTQEFDRRFSKLPAHVQARIIEAIRQLGRNLEAAGHVRMQGRPEYRLRVGDYRVLYKFDLNLNRLDLVSVGHRREIYR